MKSSEVYFYRSGLLIEQFLDENRSQLTHYGILQLNQTMRDNQLAVFFRNNHFSTIWKNQVKCEDCFYERGEISFC